MLLQKWISVGLGMLIQGSFAKELVPVSKEKAFSVNNAVAILQEEQLYELCAVYVDKPACIRTKTITVTHTVRKTKLVTHSTATTETVTRGKDRTTTVSTVTDTTSSPFATETDYSYSFVSKTRHTRTTVSVTTVYTQTTHANAPRALATFPSQLQAFPAILSKACFSALASHTSYRTTTKLSTITKTRTTTIAKPTIYTTVPRTTVTTTDITTSTTTNPYLASETTTATFTFTTTITRTEYASTTYVPAQCAPTAYVINADQYRDPESVNFSSAPNQPDALSCCELCVSTLNCQAWVWYGDPLSFPGTCIFVTGTSEDTCPAPTANSDFFPSCYGQDQNMFSIGLGACASNINLLADGCQLGLNQ